MEEKIYLLYDFCNNNFNNCFEVDNIKLGKIKLDDIKITDENESNELLKELDNGKLSVICVNTTDLIIYLKKEQLMKN